MINLSVKDADSVYENFDIFAYVEPEIEYIPETPGNKEQPEVKFVKLNLLSSAIANDTSYGDINAYSSNKTVWAESVVNDPMNQQDAGKYCAAKGLRLPSYFDLSALAKYAEDFEGYTSGNYWANPGTEKKQGFVVCLQEIAV